MRTSLENLAPKGRENCFCGSGERYKNCCRDEWPKYNFQKGDTIFSTPAGELKFLRAHITWYRLCHLAHTVPIAGLKASSGWLLSTDIKAMHELVQSARYLYDKCGILDLYPVMLGQLSSAIADERWDWCISCEEALFNLAIKDDYVAARAVLAKYRWEDVRSSELLEVYLDAYSETLGHVDIVSIATKITQLSCSHSSRFHYGFLIAIQYFLLNEKGRAEKLGRESIDKYKSLPAEERDLYGRRLLGMAVMQLGRILNDESMLREAIELLVAEVSVDRYKSRAIAEIWMQVGECYHLLRELYLAEKFYHRSLSIESTVLVNVYLANLNLDLGRRDRAKEILDALASRSMSRSNFFDYAIARCDVALVTKDTMDIQAALTLIKKVSTKDPYFKDLIKSLIVALYELQIERKSTQANSVLAKINRYLTLNPNVAGVGVNFNAMIDDYLNKK